MNDPSTEEYKQLRSELVDREQAIRQYFLFAVTTTSSILAALCTWLFKDVSAVNSMHASWQLSYSFLAPLIIIYPIAFMLINHRREIHRLAKYIQVFYDEAKQGTNWDVRIDQFRRIHGRQHTLDIIPYTFWFLIGVCLAAFYSTLHLLNGYSSWTLSILVLAVCVMFVFHRQFSASASIERDKYLNYWRQVQETESTSQVTTSLTVANSKHLGQVQDKSVDA